MAGRKRVYQSDAEKQAAYRQRREDKRKQATQGWTDKEIANIARDLHLQMIEQVKGGRYDLELLLGSSPAETLVRVSERLMPFELQKICSL